MSRLSNYYLLTYNSLQAIGWALSLYRILGSFVATQSVSGAYASAGELIRFLQIAEFLEVIHGAVGLVPTGVLLPLMQWGGRSHFLLAVVCQLNEVQQWPSVFITFLAWSLSEVIRFPHHALNCLGVCPSWLTYLRYTAFIVLYPIGAGPGEMWLMYRAIPLMIKKNLYADVFAYLPFSFYNGVRVLLVAYPFMFLKLYLHLLKQRRSKLGKPREKKMN